MVRVVIIVEEPVGISSWVSFRLAPTMPSLAMVLPLNNFWPWSFGHGNLTKKSNNLSLLSSTSDDVAANYFPEDWKFL